MPCLYIVGRATSVGGGAGAAAAAGVVLVVEPAPVPVPVPNSPATSSRGTNFSDHFSNKTYLGVGSILTLPVVSCSLSSPGPTTDTTRPANFGTIATSTELLPAASSGTTSKT